MRNCLQSKDNVVLNTTPWALSPNHTKISNLWIFNSKSKFRVQSGHQCTSVVRCNGSEWILWSLSREACIHNRIAYSRWIRCFEARLNLCREVSYTCGSTGSATENYNAAIQQVKNLVTCHLLWTNFTFWTDSVCQTMARASIIQWSMDHISTPKEWVSGCAKSTEHHPGFLQHVCGFQTTRTKGVDHHHLQQPIAAFMGICISCSNSFTSSVALYI